MKVVSGYITRELYVSSFLKEYSLWTIFLPVLIVKNLLYNGIRYKICYITSLIAIFVFLELNSEFASKELDSTGWGLTKKKSCFAGPYLQPFHQICYSKKMDCLLRKTQSLGNYRRNLFFWWNCFSGLPIIASSKNYLWCGFHFILRRNINDALD